jgi:hypothetical protein
MTAPINYSATTARISFMAARETICSSLARESSTELSAMTTTTG